jgi:hypothetical protein
MLASQTPTVLLPLELLITNVTKVFRRRASSVISCIGLNTNVVIYGIPLASRINYRIEGNAIHDDTPGR